MTTCAEFLWPFVVTISETCRQACSSQWLSILDRTRWFVNPPPALARSRSKLDSLIFMPDYVKAAAAVEEAIFSDDSDDEESSNIHKQGELKKQIEAANTTLSCLVAGDFLESLGKEPGLEVPPDQPYPKTHARPHPTQNPNIHEPLQVSQEVKRDESSSEDERRQKRSKQDGSTSDSSDDSRDRHGLRHEGRKREHRKHSKHRKHRRHESSCRSRHSADKEYGDSKREKRKWRDWCRYNYLSIFT